MKTMVNAISKCHLSNNKFVKYTVFSHLGQSAWVLRSVPLFSLAWSQRKWKKMNISPKYIVFDEKMNPSSMSIWRRVDCEGLIY